MMKIFLLLLISLLACTFCQQNSLNVKELNIVKEFLVKKEINVGRGGENFHISFAYQTGTITYSFKKNEFIEKVISDNLNNNIPQNIQDSLFQNAEKTKQIIDKYKIYSSTEKFKAVGIPLKIYMEGTSVYLYCPDTLKLINDYKEYIRNSTSISSGWYYKKEDD